MNEFPMNLRRSVALLALAGGVVACPGLRAAGNEACVPIGTAVGWIPANAAACGAVLRCEEQIEAVAESRAWARLAAMPAWEQLGEGWEHPLVRAARQVLYSELTEPGTPGGQIETLLRDPQLQRIVALLADMLSEEIVWYVDAQAADLIRTVARAGNSVRLGRLLQGDAAFDVGGSRRTAAKLLVESLADQLDTIDMPGVVWAFRVRDTQRAAEQLGKLELVASLIGWTRPELRGRLGRARIADSSYLTLTLDGRMAAPWVRRQLETLEVEPDKLDAVVARIGQLPMVVGLGLRGNYVVLSMGPSLDTVRTFHGSCPRLVDCPALAPLREALRGRLTGLAYISSELAAGLRGRPALPIDTDPQRQPGPLLAFSLWTDRGIEQFTYDWATALDWAGPEPLTLLAHAGERPLALVAGRVHINEACYAAWADRVAAVGQKIDAWIRPRLSPRSLKCYRIGVALWKPLGRRGGEAFREMLFPLVEHGQGMMVLDARRGHTGQIALRPAVVLDISRAEALRAAWAEFGEVFSEIRDALAETNTSQTGAPTAPLRSHVYHRHGADPDTVAFSLGLSERVAVAALSPGHAGELLDPCTPQLGGLLAEPRDRLSAGYLDWAGLVDLTRPTVHRWAQSVATSVTKAAEGQPSERLHGQIDTLLDLLRVVRTLSCQRYVSDGALVTHRLIEIRDLE